MKPLVIIIMGSKADLDHCRKIVEACRQFGLKTVLHIASAHKTPEHLAKIIRRYEADPQPRVFITAAGRSNALSGLVDGAVSAPVIACPPVSETFGSLDIYSSLRMPSGIAPAVILDPANAALFAAKVFGMMDPDIRKRVAAVQLKAVDQIIQDDQDLQ